MKFCEERICALIVEPANTWSNLAYIAVGLWILQTARRDKEKILAFIGVTEILTGIGSFFFHGSGTFIGEFFDLGGMFLFSAYMLIFNIWRWKNLNKKQLLTGYISLVALSSLSMLFFRPIGVPIFALQVTVAMCLELYLGITKRPLPRYFFFWAMVIAFSIAFFIWILDFRGYVCNPQNHIFQGHAAWHLINSFCFYFLYRYYRQFLTKKTSKTA